MKNKNTKSDPVNPLAHLYFPWITSILRKVYELFKLKYVTVLDIYVYFSTL